MEATTNNMELLLSPDLTVALTTATQENAHWFVSAQSKVNADVRAAYQLVGIEPEQDTPADPPAVERKMAAYLVLLTAQRQWFDTIGGSGHDPGYVLANITPTSLMVRKSFPDGGSTLLDASIDDSAPNRATIRKHVVNQTEGWGPARHQPDDQDKAIIIEGIIRLKYVNQKWQQLLGATEQS